MRIAICSSMSFGKEIMSLKESLENLNHIAIVQEDAPRYASGEIKEEDKWGKLKIDPIKVYFEEIRNADAIIVNNLDKGYVRNYIGANTLIEIAFAYVLDKKIFLLNPSPEGLKYCDEIAAMKPIVLNGDLTKIR